VDVDGKVRVIDWHMSDFCDCDGECQELSLRISVLICRDMFVVIVGFKLVAIFQGRFSHFFIPYTMASSLR